MQFIPPPSGWFPDRGQQIDLIQGKDDSGPGRPPTTSTSVVSEGRELVRVAAAWSGFFLAASFVTQIWAGSSFSPGQGGGFSELIGWSALFGLVLVAVLVLGLSRPGAVVADSGSVITGATIGYGVGVLVAVVWFTAKGGPTTGDWFVAPLLSCLGALVVARLDASRRP